LLGCSAVTWVGWEWLPDWAPVAVLGEYGQGEVMPGPAHDQRGVDFALKFGLPVRVGVETGRPDPAETGVATPGDGAVVNSGPIDGLTTADGIARITEIMASRGTRPASDNFRLRCWVVSRRRFWCRPLPIHHCAACGEAPVPDEQLPG
ncbi:leucine--tRNA ligase, partial [Actinomadura sp. BRA 177]|nr:leucine--tRNA ligase [Actinomadura sp. BRA 177]